MDQDKFRVLFLYPNSPMANMLLPAGVSILSSVLKKNEIQTWLFGTTLYADGKETFDGFRASINQLEKSTPLSQSSCRQSQFLPKSQSASWDTEL
jgi:hypothetical protein